MVNFVETNLNNEFLADFMPNAYAVKCHESCMPSLTVAATPMCAIAQFSRGRGIYTTRESENAR
jgi:hypothetical protein